MALEIERKYLVTGNPWEQYKKAKKTPIKQGYISKSPKHTVRVRVTDKKALITIKGPTKGFTRDEYEYEIPYDDGQDLLKLCDGHIIDKVRYTFTDSYDQTWEVDVFRGINDGLVVAEIELTSEDINVNLPDWVTREVTFDKRYTNAYISNHKIPTEDDVL